MENITAGDGGLQRSGFSFTTLRLYRQPRADGTSISSRYSEAKGRASRLSYVALAKYGPRHAATRCDRRAAHR
jgi:hypothetical protein